ncbi:hypothetical protein N431DRAFT_549121 [Stipitochalara longipes BDJ]|nr:hypothetical protein N431DRAFT_549121 [Stipitochalara longipes BDJ]
MSHQPSAIDTIKRTTNSAYETVTNTVAPTEQSEYNPDKDKTNFKKDAHGNTVKKGDLKDKLNEAAFGGPPEKEESYVDKVRSYIPVVSKMQQQTSEQEEAENAAKHEGPPDRPDHDVQVEQFLRKQYHSKSGDGMPNPDSKD